MCGTPIASPGEPVEIMSPKKNTLTRCMGGVVLLAAAGFAALPAAAQCSLNTAAGGVRQFEPTPPGAGRPGTLNWASVDGFFLYKPAGVSTRLLVPESMGYQIVDLTDPMNPVALGFEDYRYTPATPIPCTGDCHSSVSVWGVSDDGARFHFGLNDLQTSAYHDVVGFSSVGDWHVNLRADLAVPKTRTGSVVHRTPTNRYLAYALGSTGLYAADVTSLPGSLAPNNVATQNTGLPAGTAPVLAGNWLAYLGITPFFQKTGSVLVVNVATPGPAGNIVAGLSLTTIALADWARPAGETPSAFGAAVDPSDPSVLWILAEFQDSSFRSAGYSLLKLVNGVKQPPATTFRPTFAAGETWDPGGSPVLAATGGNLYALMWASRRTPSSLSRLYSVAVSSFGSVAPGSFDVNPATPAFASFGTGYAMPALAGAANALYLYVASHTKGWVVPVTCVSPNSPPASELVVQPVPCPGGGPGPCPLAANDTVFVGTTLQITPQVASAKTILDWRFDYDFHVGGAEDRGTAPRLNNADLASPATLPSTITLVGPCDPRSGGVPASGTGCWASATANGDFPAGAAPGTTRTLTLALEAANVNGPGNTKTLPLAWKVPAVRLQNPNVLLGQPLASGADGTPLATGYKWYFGASSAPLVQAACTGPTCTPALPKGTYSWWLTVPYPGGYTSPDCGTPCTQSLGTFSISDVSLAFTGIPATAVAGAGLNVTDASSAAAGAAACGNGLEYAICDAGAGPCAATNWQPLALTPGGGLSTNVPAPSSAGTYWLRIRYSYRTTGSCTAPLVAAWTPGVPGVPGVADATAWPVVVTPLPPTIQILVNGTNPCLQPGACSDGIPANIGDSVTVTAWLGFQPDPNPPPTTAWSYGAGASPSGCSGTGCQVRTFTYTAPGSPVVTLSGYPGISEPAAAKPMNVSVPPVSATNSTLPSGVCAGSPVTLTASPTIAGATYAWTGPFGYTSSAQNPVLFPPASGTYTVTRTVAGSPNSTASTTAVLLAPPPVPTAGNNGPVCSGQTLSLTAPAIANATYAWTGPNGFTSSQQSPSVANATPAATGTYVVTATVNGCSTAASTSAAVNARPAAPAAGNSGPLCIGGTLQLTASAVANATYAWTGPNGFTSVLQNPTIPGVTSAAAGTYSVTATVNGCPGPAGTTVAVVSGASAAITAPSSLCLPAGASGSASVANAGAGATYAWTVTNGTIVTGQGTPAITFGASAGGTTTVAVVVTAGGCATSSSVAIPVAARCGGLGTLAPCRVLDTRNPNGSLGGPPIGPASGRRFFATNVCDIPPGKTAISANVTILSRNALGSIVVYPGDLPAPPNTSTVSVVPGRTRANNAIVKLAPDGSFWIWNTTTGTVDVVLDVNGYFD